MNWTEALKALSEGKTVVTTSLPERRLVLKDGLVYDESGNVSMQLSVAPIVLQEMAARNWEVYEPKPAYPPRPQVQFTIEEHFFLPTSAISAVDKMIVARLEQFKLIPESASSNDKGVDKPSPVYEIVKK